MEDNSKELEEYAKIFEENCAMKIDQTTYTGPTTKAKRLTLLIGVVLIIAIILVCLQFI